MSQQSDIDKLLRQRLQGAEVPPPAFVWPNVERELRQRRRRALIWWFTGGLMLVSCIAVGGWLWATMDVPPASAHLYQQSIPAGRIEQNAGQRANNTATDAPKPMPNLAPLVVPSATKGIQSTTSAHAYPKTVESTSISGQNGEYFTANTSKSVETNVSTTADKSEKKPVETTSRVQAILPEGMQVTASDEGAATIPATAIEQDAASEALKLPALSREMRLLPTVFAAPPPFSRIKSHTKKKPNKYKNCYDFNSHPTVFLLDGYIGPSLARKEIRSVKAEESWYRQRRLATERRDWAFHAGVRGTLLFKQNFLFRTGLHYDQMVETFEFADPNYKEVNIRQISKVVNGQVVTTIDTSISYGEHYFKTYNRFGMLDIPLQVGVEVRKGRVGVALQAGASVNILFWKRGSILSPSEQPVRFTPSEGGEEVFRARTGLSVSGSAQWFYHLRPRLRLFAEPYFRQILRPVTLDTHPVEQRYGIAGVRLGLTAILD